MPTSWRALLLSKFAAPLRLNVCWCVSEACKYKKRNRSRRILTQLQYSLLKAYCWFCIYSIEIFTSVFARKYYEQMVAFIQSESLELYIKNFKTCQLKKIVFVFAGLNVNIIFQRKSIRKMHVLSMMLVKARGINISMLKLGCCLPPPIKISGYAPGWTMCPECHRKDWWDKSCWLHSRESGPEIVQEPGVARAWLNEREPLGKVVTAKPPKCLVQRRNVSHALVSTLQKHWPNTSKYIRFSSLHFRDSWSDHVRRFVCGSVVQTESCITKNDFFAITIQQSFLS